MSCMPCHQDRQFVLVICATDNCLVHVYQASTSKFSCYYSCVSNCHQDRKSILVIWAKLESGQLLLVICAKLELVHKLLLIICAKLASGPTIVIGHVCQATIRKDYWSERLACAVTELSVHF